MMRAVTVFWLCAGVLTPLSGLAQPQLDVVDPWKHEPIAALDPGDPWDDVGFSLPDIRDPWQGAEPAPALPELQDPWADVRSPAVAQQAIPTASFADLAVSSVAAPSSAAPRSGAPSPATRRAPVPTAAFPLP
ncbi:MAG: hypothetical protein R3B13_40565 [Polyangiaceae bacterium]